jgi:hypothetical protein
MCECVNMPSRMDGSKVEELSSLSPFVEEISTDFKKWETTFKCRECGQEWLERYESRGHASVPIVERVL